MREVIAMNFNIDSLKFDKDGLIPAVIQNSITLKTLMLGYMNKEAVNKTIASGTVWFYSRSRQKLWNKGETSGNYLKTVKIFADCDCDCLLIYARPAVRYAIQITKAVFLGIFLPMKKTIRPI